MDAFSDATSSARFPPTRSGRSIGRTVPPPARRPTSGRRDLESEYYDESTFRSSDYESGPSFHTAGESDPAADDDYFSSSSGLSRSRSRRSSGRDGGSRRSSAREQPTASSGLSRSRSRRSSAREQPSASSGLSRSRSRRSSGREQPTASSGLSRSRRTESDGHSRSRQDSQSTGLARSRSRRAMSDNQSRSRSRSRSRRSSARETESQSGSRSRRSSARESASRSRARSRSRPASARKTPMAYDGETESQSARSRSIRGASRGRSPHPDLEHVSTRHLSRDFDPESETMFPTTRLPDEKSARDRPFAALSAPKKERKGKGKQKQVETIRTTKVVKTTTYERKSGRIDDADISDMTSMTGTTGSDATFAGSAKKGRMMLKAMGLSNSSESKDGSVASGSKAPSSCPPSDSAVSSSSASASSSEPSSCVPETIEAPKSPCGSRKSKAGPSPARKPSSKSRSKPASNCPTPSSHGGPGPAGSLSTSDEGFACPFNPPASSKAACNFPNSLCPETVVLPKNGGAFETPSEQTPSCHSVSTDADGKLVPMCFEDDPCEECRSKVGKKEIKVIIRDLPPTFTDCPKRSEKGEKTATAYRSSKAPNKVPKKVSPVPTPSRKSRAATKSGTEKNPRLFKLSTDGAGPSNHPAGKEPTSYRRPARVRSPSRGRAVERSKSRPRVPTTRSPTRRPARERSPSRGRTSRPARDRSTSRGRTTHRPARDRSASRGRSTDRSKSRPRVPTTREPTRRPARERRHSRGGLERTIKKTSTTRKSSATKLARNRSGHVKKQMLFTSESTVFAWNPDDPTDDENDFWMNPKEVEKDMIEKKTDAPTAKTPVPDSAKERPKSREASKKSPSPPRKKYAAETKKSSKKTVTGPKGDKEFSVYKKKSKTVLMKRSSCPPSESVQPVSMAPEGSIDTTIETGSIGNSSESTDVTTPEMKKSVKMKSKTVKENGRGKSVKSVKTKSVVKTATKARESNPKPKPCNIPTCEPPKRSCAPKKKACSPPPSSPKVLPTPPPPKVKPPPSPTTRKPSPVRRAPCVPPEPKPVKKPCAPAKKKSCAPKPVCAPKPIPTVEPPKAPSSCAPSVKADSCAPSMAPSEAPETATGTFDGLQLNIDVKSKGRRCKDKLQVMLNIKHK